MRRIKKMLKQTKRTIQYYQLPKGQLYNLFNREFASIQTILILYIIKTNKNKQKQKGLNVKCKKIKKNCVGSLLFYLSLMTVKHIKY